MVAVEVIREAVASVSRGHRGPALVRFSSPRHTGLRDETVRYLDTYGSARVREAALLSRYTANHPKRMR